MALYARSWALRSLAVGANAARLVTIPPLAAAEVVVMYQAFRSINNAWTIVGEHFKPIADFDDQVSAQALAEWANRQVREGNLSDDEIIRQLRFEASERTAA